MCRRRKRKNQGGENKNKRPRLEININQDRFIDNNQIRRDNRARGNYEYCRVKNVKSVWSRQKEKREKRH
ncbi:uncharacterized protein EI90DRAFT_3040651, partial [Cantharellus anzutake]|uniref:uncharacterized protein n=1 Tax=Cantharellus anzutake TaxID=1750568 RepID=UPI00190531CC